MPHMMRLFYEKIMKFEEINPWHAAQEQISDESCKFITRVQLLIKTAGNFAKTNGDEPLDLIFEAINYLVKQETNGAPLEFDEAIKRLEPLLEGLQEGVVEPSANEMTESNAVRNGIITKWRSWAFEYGVKGEEERLRGVIGAAYLRLARLDNSNPEVCHARQLLECAMNGNRADWP